MSDTPYDSITADKLRQINDLTPGVADRLLVEWERENTHRRAFDLRRFDAEVESKRFLRWAWAVGAAVAVVTGGAVSAAGRPEVGVGLGAVQAAVAAGTAWAATRRRPPA